MTISSIIKDRVFKLNKNNFIVESIYVKPETYIEIMSELKNEVGIINPDKITFLGVKIKIDFSLNKKFIIGVDSCRFEEKQ